MARVIICPVGLSIFQGKQGLGALAGRLTPGHELQQARAVIDALGERVDALSAELATLRALGVEAGDGAVFLATDTDPGAQAAKANAVLAERRFGVDATVERIPGLVLDDVVRFRRQGIPALVQVMEKHVSRGRSAGREPVLGVSGGVKPAIPYVAAYGMLGGVRLTYVFEGTGELVSLPRLPIAFDWGGVALAERVLREAERETAIDRKRLEDLLGDELSRLEGLFEEMDGQVTLSAFGLMLLDSLRRAAEQPTMLSPSAARRLEQLHGTERKAIEAMLDRVRNPLVRAHKVHTVHGTDLDVYKPGNTSPRLAYWVEGDTVYVAEVYAAHDDYMHDLPGRLKKAYPREDFVPRWPDSIPGSDDDPLGDETVAVALQEQQRAERERGEARAAEARAMDERDQALALADECDGARHRLEDQLGEMRRRAADLESRMADLAGCGNEVMGYLATHPVGVVVVG